MYPEIFSSGQSQAVLNNAFNAKLTEKLNAERLFQFSAYEEALKTEYIQIGNQVEIKDQTYDINYVETAHDITGKIEYRVQSEHVSYRLIDTELDSYANTDTPANILDDLLTGTDFTVGTIDFTDPIIFVVNEKSSKLNLILRLVAQLGAELGYSNKGFAIDILNSIGQNTGFEIRIRKNLKSIVRVVDNRGELKTSYKINYVNLDESEGYALKGLEKADLGDTVKIIDEVINVDITNIVLKRVTDPIQETTIDVEIASTLESFTNTFNDLTQSSIIKGNRIYGVTIDQQSGLVVERDDQLAKSIFNADEWKAQVGDGLGAYTDALFFDVLNNRYKFVGEIEVEAITGLDADDVAESPTRIWADTSWRETGKTTIAGGAIETDTVTALQIAALTITANELAANAVTASKIDVNELSAISADIGSITAGTITGVTITGGTIRTSSTGERLELSADDFKSFNSSNQLDGVQILSGFYNELAFYEANTETARIARALGALLFDTDDVTFLLSGSYNISAPGGAFYGGAEIVTTAGNGLDKSGATLLVDPSEIAGDGLAEDAFQNLEVALGTGLRFDLNDVELDLTYTDDRYCVNESSNEMGFQEFGDDLEVFQNGVLTHTIAMVPV